MIGGREQASRLAGVDRASADPGALAAEVERLRGLRLDERTGRLQRNWIRVMVAASVALIVSGQCMEWARGGSPGAAATGDAWAALQAFPSGHSLMVLGLLVGVATPMVRALLLARWFAGRGERVMVWISALLMLILLSGLLLRH